MAFDVVAAVYDPPTAANADCIVQLPHAAFVIDGASSLQGETVAGQPAAAWLAGELGAALGGFAGGDIDSFARAAMTRIAARYASLVDSDTTDSRPFCCLIGCILHDDAIELVSWGDCQAIVTDIADGRTDLFGYCSVAVLDDAVLRAVEHAKAEAGLDHSAAFALCVDTIEANRKRRNVDRAYQVLDLTSPMVGVPERRFLDRRKSWRILLTSDGLFRTVACYAMSTVEQLARCDSQASLSRLLSDMRALEDADRSCETYPRLKSSDDVGAIVLNSLAPEPADGAYRAATAP